MSKRKKPAVEAYDKAGPPNMSEDYTWCPECQGSYRGEVCPGCSPGIGTAQETAEKLVDLVDSGGNGQGYGDPGAEDAAVVNPELSDEDLQALSTETTTITEILPVPLTDGEYKEIAIKMGLADQEASLAEDELNSVKAQYKSRIVSAEGRRNEFSSIINSGHQQKQVECHLVKDFQKNTITLVRLDTGEIVRTRTMTANERQRGLFPPGPPPDPSCIDPTD